MGTELFFLLIFLISFFTILFYNSFLQFFFTNHLEITIGAVIIKFLLNGNLKQEVEKNVQEYFQY